MKVTNVHAKSRERGHQILEFAFFVIVLTPLLLGTFVIGMNLGRSVQVAQLGRDAGSMWVRGIDFSQTANKQELARLGQSLGMQVTGGTGIVILTKITYIGTCTAPCNQNSYVITQRLVIGNSSARSSNFGPTGTVTTDSFGNVLNYTTDTNARATNISGLLTLNVGEFAYVSEAYFPSPDYDLPGFQSGTGVYAVAFY